MFDLLPKSFYLSEDVVQVAKDLLGKVIHTNIDGQYTSGRIVETEAYRAPDDKACHAYNDRRTKRTETMFADGGVAYIYLCYGIHHLFNVVTAPRDVAHAVLIRGIEPIDGMDIMLQRRGKSELARSLTAGPGSLSAAMGIRKSLTGTSLYDATSAIYITEAHPTPPDQIIASPRVGVIYAEECAAWPWRFRIKESKWTSPAK